MSFEEEAKERFAEIRASHPSLAKFVADITMAALKVIPGDSHKITYHDSKAAAEEAAERMFNIVEDFFTLPDGIDIPATPIESERGE